MGILYRYFTAHRPPAPGAIPRGAVDCTSYDTRTYVPEIDGQAWGEAAYDHPLTEAEIEDYELVPAKGISRKKEQWIVFYAPDGTELLAYTAKGTFRGELEATIELLAHEKGIDPREISFAEVTR